LAAVDAQLTAQFPVLFAQVDKGRGFTDTKLFQRGTSGVLSDIPRLPDGALESVP